MEEQSKANGREMRLALRKRKRRPQPENSSLSVENDNETNLFSTTTTTTKPQSSAAPFTAQTQRRRATLSTYRIREPLAALAEEEQKRNHTSIMRMRKQSASSSTTVDATTVTTMQPIDLKNILKHSGGLSLVEILQQKNISLDDLLKGKKNALLALQPTTTTAASTTMTTMNASTKYVKPARKIPSSFLTTNVQHSSSTTTTFSTLENMPSEREDTEPDLATDADDKNVVQMATIATLRDNPPLRKNILFPNSNLIKRRPALSIKAKNSTTIKGSIAAVVAPTTTTTKTTVKSTTKMYPVVKNRFAATRPKFKVPSIGGNSGGFFPIFFFYI